MNFGRRQGALVRERFSSTAFTPEGRPQLLPPSSVPVPSAARPRATVIFAQNGDKESGRRDAETKAKAQEGPEASLAVELAPGPFFVPE
ncbi:MAG: hypothetical protein K6E40_11270 [Desulfovibrio sp.]|nr:hypothetical protein [Desulfovibrio sp.]